MKDTIYIKSRLEDLCNMFVPQEMEYTIKHRAKIEIVSWAYNNGEIRTLQEIENKLKNLEEEKLGLVYVGDNGFQTAIVDAKITEIKNILN